MIREQEDLKYETVLILKDVLEMQTVRRTFPQVNYQVLQLFGWS